MGDVARGLILAQTIWKLFTHGSAVPASRTAETRMDAGVRCRPSSSVAIAGLRWGLEVPSSNLGAPMAESPANAGLSSSQERTTSELWSPAIAGAVITSRHELEETPPPPATKPAAATPARPATAQPKPKPARSAAAASPPSQPQPLQPTTLRPIPAHFDWNQEVNRRIDLVESQGLVADVEEIVINLPAELGHPSIDRTWARLAARRRLR